MGAKDLKNKPLIEMSSKEMRAAFDQIGLGNAFVLLQDARHGKGQTLYLVAAVLVLPDQTERYAVTDLEYGDGEGIRYIEEFIEEIGRAPGILAPGEKMRFGAWRVTGLEEASKEIARFRQKHSD